MTSGEIDRAIVLAGGTLGKTPVYRLDRNNPPPERIRLAARVEDITIVYYADVHDAQEAPEKRIRVDNGTKIRRGLFTYWRLWITLPELLPGALIGGLQIDGEATLPVNGVLLKFRVSQAGPDT